jgi:ABC-type sugar transport system substrate-binding protein
VTRRAAPAALLAGLLAILAGCGGDHSAERGGSPGAGLAAVIKGLDNPFFVALHDGLVETARSHRVALRLEEPASSRDAEGQASRLESLASPAAACYVVNPIARSNLVAPLGHLPAGTPIVNVDTAVGTAEAAAVGVKVTTFIGTDNAAAAMKGADAMAAVVHRGAAVAVIAGVPGNAPSDLRIDGFSRGARGRFDVVETVAADYERPKARRAARELLHTRPDLKGIFAVNDLMALGAAEAVRAAGRSADVAVVGFDGIRQALDAVAHGALAATVTQYPYTMGQLAVEACLAAAAGKRLPAIIDAPVAVITRENVALARARFPRPVEPFESPLARLVR